MYIVVNFLATACAVLIAAEFVPGFSVADFSVAAFVAVLLGIIGITLRPILLLLTLPINLISLGLFSFVINAGIVWGLALVVEGFDITGFIPALLGGIVIAGVQWLVHRFI